MKDDPDEGEIVWVGREQDAVDADSLGLLECEPSNLVAEALAAFARSNLIADVAAVVLEERDQTGGRRLLEHYCIVRPEYRLWKPERRMPGAAPNRDLPLE